MVPAPGMENQISEATASSGSAVIDGVLPQLGRSGTVRLLPLAMLLQWSLLRRTLRKIRKVRAFLRLIPKRYSVLLIYHGSIALGRKRKQPAGFHTRVPGRRKGINTILVWSEVGAQGAGNRLPRALVGTPACPNNVVSPT